MVEFLVGPVEPDVDLNLVDALVALDVLRPYLSNWTQVVRYFIRGVEADAAADATPETADLLDRLSRYQDVKSVMALTVSPSLEAPVLPMHVRKGETELRLFTTIATLGTPQDITLQELRIESFFPMDDETRAVFRSWAAAAKRSDQPRRVLAKERGHARSPLSNACFLDEPRVAGTPCLGAKTGLRPTASESLHGTACQVVERPGFLR